MYNMSGFRTKIMYDYYIVMKSMFLVVKLSSHLIIGYASLTILLSWITHKQHQNYSKTKSSSINQNFNSPTLYSYHNFVQKWRCFSRSQTPLYILTKRNLLKKLPKTYPSHGSPNNQKKTKSHGSPCDSTINHKEQHHMVHHVIPQLITRKQHHMVHHVIPQLITKKQHHMVSHVIPQLITSKQHHMVSSCDFTINHKQTTSHGFLMWFHN
jgi:hypothetical protein